MVRIRGHLEDEPCPHHCCFSCAGSIPSHSFMLRRSCAWFWQPVKCNSSNKEHRTRHQWWSTKMKLTAKQNGNQTSLKISGSWLIWSKSAAKSHCWSRRENWYWSHLIILHPFLSFYCKATISYQPLFTFVHHLYSSLEAKWRSWWGTWLVPLFQFPLLLRHWLQFYPNLLVITSPFRTPVGHGYPLIQSIWTPTAKEGETLTRDRVGLFLMMVAGISACLYCHISRLSTTTQCPWTCWTCSRTRGSCWCALHDAAFCLPTPFISGYISW